MSAREPRGIRSLRRVRDDDAGLTLVELLVAVGIMGIVLTIVANLFISTVKSTEQSGDVHESTGNISNMANELNGVIRFATTNAKTGSATPDPAIVAATADRLVLMSAVTVSATVEPGGRPPRPTLVEFTVSATRQLTERRWNPTASGATWVFPGGTDPTSVTPASSRVLGARLTTGGPAMFTYFDATGGPVTPGATGLTAAQRATVAAIGIRLSVVPPDDLTAQPVVIVRRIPLVNLGLREPS